MTKIELSEEQMKIANKAIHNVLEKNEQSFITGPAGCGKTTIANEIAKRLLELEMNVYFVAPTHTAANRLERVLCEGENNFRVSTIHSFLKMRMTKQEFGNKIFEFTADPREIFDIKSSILIVDEASMLEDDIYFIINKVCKHRVVFLGDSCQIPAIAKDDEKKSRLLTIKDSEPAVKRYVKNIFELKKVYRQDNESALYKLCKFLRDSILDNTCVELYDNKKKLLDEIRKFALLDDDTIFIDIPGNEVVPSILNIEDTCFLAFGNPTIQSVQKHLPEWYVEGGYAITNDSIGEIVQIDGVESHRMLFSNNEHIKILSITKANVKKWGVIFDSVTIESLDGFLSTTIFVPSFPDAFQAEYIKWINVAKYNAGIANLTPDESLNYKFNDFASLTDKSLNKFMFKVATLREGRASTVHRAQGQQWNNCIIAFNNIMFSGVNMNEKYKDKDIHRKIIAMKLLYTAISRSKEKVIFCFENKKEAYEPKKLI